MARVEGMLGSPPEGLVGLVFYNFIYYLEAPKGLGGSLEVLFGVRGVRERPGRGGEVPGSFRCDPGAAAGSSIFCFLEGDLSTVE